MAEKDPQGKVGPKELARELRISVRHARRWLALMHERYPHVVRATSRRLRRRRYWIVDWRQFVATLEDDRIGT